MNFHLIQQAMKEKDRKKERKRNEEKPQVMIMRNDV